MTFKLLASSQLTPLVTYMLGIFELGHHGSETLEKLGIHTVFFPSREMNFQMGVHFLFSEVLNVEQGWI